MRLTKNSIIIDKKNYCYWQANKSAKKVVILLHGFPGNHQSLIEFSGYFSDYNVIIPDLPACGDSDQLSKKGTLDNYTDWLNKFFIQLKLNSPIIIGHSFGSRLALSFSEANPNRLKALVLITPVVKVEGIIAQFAAWEYQIAGLLPEKLQKIWLSNGLYKNITTLILYKTSKGELRKKLIAMASKEISKVSPKVSIELFNDFNDSNLMRSAKKVSVPTLVIAGGLDEIAPKKLVKVLTDALPKAKYTLCEKSGHMLPLEQPKLTAKIINQWFKTIKV